MKTILFLLKKIIIIEIMLIILSLISQFFQLEIPIVSNIIYIGLKYITPLAIISLVLYIILSILNKKTIEIALGVILGGMILFHLIKRL